MLAAAERPAAHDPITTKITFSREIRAILSARCAACHSPGGSAPMSLTTYENVRPWARAIKEQVLARRMPKWHAARGFGSFKNDPTLTPIEIAMIVSWVDGGLPFSTSAPRPGSASSPSVMASAFRRKVGIPIVRIPAGKNEAVARVRAQWVSAWSFEPGDPLITSATFTLADGTVVGSWVAGDAPVTLPANSAIRIPSSLRVVLQRRVPADYEQPYKARASVLRVVTRAKAPARRTWVERVSCGSAWTGRPAQVLAIRPMIEDGGAARIWIERGGAPKTIVGWFRDFDTRFPRTYWLARPADFSTEARMSSSERCEAMLTLVAAR
jgi:hypothetical protein